MDNDGLQHFVDWGANPESYFYEQVEIEDNSQFRFVDVFLVESFTSLSSQEVGSITDNSGDVVDTEFKDKNRDRWTIQSRLYVNSSLPDEYLARLKILEDEVDSLNPRFNEYDLKFLEKGEDILAKGAELLRRSGRGKS
jgi:hypothetical protein